MLSAFRNLSKSKVGTLILGLFLLAIVASFAIADMGNSGAGGPGGSPGSLAEAGDEQVTERDFSTAMERLLSAARQQNPEATYAALAKDIPGLIDQLLDAAALQAFARDQDMLLSRRLIDGQIATLPGTRGLDGKFSDAAYADFLSQQRLTDDQVRRLLAADLIRQVTLGPAVANARIPVGLATQYASMLLEQRRGQLILVQNEAFRAGLDPTTGDLQAYYEQNRARYIVPEQRVLRFAAIGPEQVAAVVPTDAEIAAFYTANRATYGGREVRVISQAVVPSKPVADAIAQRARLRADADILRAEPGGSSRGDEARSRPRSGCNRVGDRLRRDHRLADHAHLAPPVRGTIGSVEGRDLGFGRGHRRDLLGPDRGES